MNLKVQHIPVRDWCDCCCFIPLQCSWNPRAGRGLEISYFIQCSSLFPCSRQMAFQLLHAELFRDRIGFPCACFPAHIMNPGRSGTSSLLQPRREEQRRLQKPIAMLCVQLLIWGTGSLLLGCLVNSENGFAFIQTPFSKHMEIPRGNEALIHLLRFSLGQFSL